MSRRSRFTITKRILILPAVLLLGFIAMQGVNYYFEREVTARVVLPNFSQQVLGGSQNVLKALVEAEAKALGELVKPLKTREEKVAAVVQQTDPIRFFDDGSGYFFTYDLKGIRINVPINKAKNGQDCSGLKDEKGKLFVEEFVKAAQSGAGFVEYLFEKPGKGVQPKLSYVKLIPGTDILVGTGVYIDNVQEETAKLQTTVQAATNQYLLYKAGAVGGFLVALVVVSLLITRSITRPVQHIIAELSAGADQTAVISGQVSSTSQNLAQGASEQAASLEETSSSLEEMSSMTKKNADTAQQAASLSAEAKKAADQGNAAMGKMSDAINDIQKSASQTAKIIKVIDEIAFQTNLLALNAAVEAARAGEAGKGFAVVAEEVRNLAMRSAEAAKNTSALIEESVNNAKNGVSISTEVGKVLEEITASNTKVNSLVGEIAAASNEQARGIEQVNTAVGQMDKVTQSNAANAEESASASEELATQTQHLRSTVNELVILVGGTVQGAPSQDRPQTRRTRKATASVTTQKTLEPAAGVGPDPLLQGSEQQTGADFSDFSKAA